MRGKAIHLSGKPKSFPEMEDDSMEVIINGGMIFLFAVGVAQVMHEDDAAAVLQELGKSDLQVSSCTAFAAQHFDHKLSHPSHHPLGYESSFVDASTLQ